MKHWLWTGAGLLFVLGALWFIKEANSTGQAGFQRARVTRGTIIRKATAVGRIEVEHEVPVNSQFAGVLQKLFVRAGQKVEAGTPLAEVRPVSTEQSILAAERNLELAIQAEESANEYFEKKHIASRLTQFMLGENNLTRMHESAVLNRKEAEERLALLKNGKIKVDNRIVDFIVRAPVAGHVLEIKQREGTPVVPPSTYGFGTVFITLADMNQLLFRGTVDEIDVGRLTEGMTAQIKIGALPGKIQKGKLIEIALKGQERNNAMVFDVLIQLDIPPDTVLRSGYSAVAEVEIERRENVLCLPERLIEFRDHKTLVQLPDKSGRPVTREIEAGLSDGLTVEIVRGLAEGEEVLERTPLAKSL